MSITSVQPGDVLAGKYRVERVLGSGGMGYVVAARHLQLDQLVAMKFLRQGTSETSDATKRFLREAKAAVKLRNEHVAKVYDVGTLETGEPYMVMEYLDGCDLAVLAKERTTIPASEATEYVLQACEALAEAHALRIIHRDIKLANLFVTRGPAGSPVVKVLDFGISKTNPFGESEHDMTRTASMLGSPRFMSPEQMRDPRAVDGRTDIWSLGVVLYRLVSGRAPFDAETLGRLLTMVMHEPEPPLSAICANIPPGFDQVVARCLQKDPRARFSSVAELAFALVPYAMDHARARATAERIAAVQSVPISADGSGPLPMPGPLPGPGGSSRVSIPAAVNNNTASPWSKAQGGPGRSSTTTTLLAVALAAILVSAGVFARAYRAKTHARSTTAAESVLAETAPVPIPAPATSSSQLATVIGASTPSPPAQPAPPPARSEPARRAPVTTSRSKSSAAARPSSTAAPKDDDGIPTTRD